MKKIFSTIIVVIVVAAMLIPSVGAYNILDYRLKTDEEFEIYLHNDLNFVSEEMSRQILSASQDWMNLHPKSFVSIKKSNFSDSNYPSLDGKNVIYIQPDKYDRYLGKTTVWYENGRVVEADININPEIRWILDGTDQDGINFYSTILHEFGHLIGLNHSNNPKSCMRPYLLEGEQFKIAEIDINGFNAIYNKKMRSASFDLRMEDNKTDRKYTDTKDSGGLIKVTYKMMPRLNLDQVVETSDLILIAKAVDRSDSFGVNCPIGVESKNFVEFDMETKQILKNDLGYDDDKLTIRVECRNDCNKYFNRAFTERCFEGYKLYFLKLADKGGQFVTDCSKYFVLPYTDYDVFDINNVTGKISNDLGSCTFDELLDAIEKDAAIPKEMKKDSLELNYERGIIDEVLYTKIVESYDYYGKIADKKEEIINVGQSCSTIRTDEVFRKVMSNIDYTEDNGEKFNFGTGSLELIKPLLE